MIIIEGCDGSGKTHLARKLSRLYELPIAPRVVQKDTTHTMNLVKWVEDNLGLGFQRKIFDRHRLISEPVYGSVLPRGISPEFNGSLWFKAQVELLKSLNPIIIYCNPGLRTIRNNLANDRDNEVIRPYIEDIFNTYEMVMETTWKGLFIPYNYKTDSLGLVSNALFNRIYY